MFSVKERPLLKNPALKLALLVGREVKDIAEVIGNPKQNLASFVWLTVATSSVALGFVVHVFFE